MRLVLGGLLLALVGTSVDAQKSKRRCTGTPVDTSATTGRVYQDCEVDRVAKQRGATPRIVWNPSSSATAGPECYRARFEFVVDSAGIPEVATIRRISSSDAGFEQAVREQILDLRYDPAELDGRRVRQLVVYESKAALRRVVVSSSGGAGPPPRPPMC